MRDWSRNDTIGMVSLLVALISCFAALIMVPEVRSSLGLSKDHQPAESPLDQQGSPAPMATAAPASIPPTSVPVRSTASDPVPEERESQPAVTPPIERDTGTVQSARETPAPRPEEISETEGERREREMREEGDRLRRAQRPDLESIRREQELREQGDAQRRARDSEDTLQEQQARLRNERAQSAREEQATAKGLVFFKVTPADASIYLDGKFVGTPADLAGGIRVPKGEHDLAIVRPGYEARKETLNVPGGDSLDIKVDLKRAE